MQVKPLPGSARFDTICAIIYCGLIDGAQVDVGVVMANGVGDDARQTVAEALPVHSWTPNKKKKKGLCIRILDHLHLHLHEVLMLAQKFWASKPW